MATTNPARTVGYLRVSTADQDMEKNKAGILAFANAQDLGRVEFIEEKASGKTPWRKRKIADLLETLGNGDNLIVSELSRLGRSMLECMEILSIATQRGIRVYALKGNWKLDHTLQSKIIAMAFSMAAEIERDLISARTTEALRVRKDAGNHWGVPRGRAKASWMPAARRSRHCWPMAPPRSSSPHDIRQPPPTCPIGSGKMASGNHT